jgi:hypothetical protein
MNDARQKEIQRAQKLNICISGFGGGSHSRRGLQFASLADIGLRQLDDGRIPKPASITFA